MTAQDFENMTAADVLAALCPQGDPIEGVDVDQDWDAGTTRISFEDGSALLVGVAIVEVA